MDASNSHPFSEAKNINVDCLAQCEAVNMFSAKLIPFLVSLLHVKGDCLSGSCEKTFLDVYQDAFQDSEFVGHVFRSSVTLNPIQCYTWCIQDCRCLSFNLKEKNDDQKYCELNEGNHFTSKSSLKHSLGTSYYILRRKYEAKVKNYCLELARFEQKYICLLRLFLSVQECVYLSTDWRKKS